MTLLLCSSWPFVVDLFKILKCIFISLKSLTQSCHFRIQLSLIIMFVRAPCLFLQNSFWRNVIVPNSIDEFLKLQTKHNSNASQPLWCCCHDLMKIIQTGAMSMDLDASGVVLTTKQASIPPLSRGKISQILLQSRCSLENKLLARNQQVLQAFQSRDLGLVRLSPFNMNLLSFAQSA